jgi:16S rRNA processing protein RimM
LPADGETHGSGRVRVGRVGRPHGIDGAFVVEEGSEDPRRFQVGATLLVDGEPATVVGSRRIGRGRMAVRLDRAVERGAALEVLRDDLPPTEAGSYYVADLLGMEVVEIGGGPLGIVQDVLPGPANDALELDTGILLPLVEDCVREIDPARRLVLVAPGFLGDR